MLVMSYEIELYHSISIFFFPAYILWYYVVAMMNSNRIFCPYFSSTNIINYFS